eukprot:scaffold10725_cov147-Cylindrotheca_fusiformis.AAC.5
MSENSPLCESVGRNRLSPGSTSAQMEALADDINDPFSLSSVEKVAGIVAARSVTNYQEEVLDYISEWAKIVTTIVDSELDTFDRLEEQLYHYEVKVDRLRKKFKGKKNIELSRHEKKLRDAREERKEQLKKVCFILKAILEDSWRDFRPLVMQTLTWEMRRVSGELDTYGTLLPKMLDKMKRSIKNYKYPSSSQLNNGSRTRELTKQTIDNMKLEYQINYLEEILKGEWSTREEITLKLKESVFM